MANNQYRRIGEEMSDPVLEFKLLEQERDELREKLKMATRFLMEAWPYMDDKHDDNAAIVEFCGGKEAIEAYYRERER